MNRSWSNRKTPVIGILTARKKDGLIAGNGTLFMELQKKLISLNGISFIFTLDGVHQETIDGFIFTPERNGWKRITAPFPDLVYNRIPFRRSEEELKMSMFFASLKKKIFPFLILDLLINLSSITSLKTIPFFIPSYQLPYQPIINKCFLPFYLTINQYT